jgi:hypothetical protein
MADIPILCDQSVIKNIMAGRQVQDRRPAIGKNGKPTIWQGVKTGDRLWVRETWQALSFGDYQPTDNQPCDIRYAATDVLGCAAKDVRGYAWRPSIHCPRWASRLTLVVTEARIHRLQDITADEIQAEGCPIAIDHSDQEDLYWWIDLWDGIYAASGRAWDANPEVVAMTFTLHPCNIGNMS